MHIIHSFLSLINSRKSVEEKQSVLAQKWKSCTIENMRKPAEPLGFESALERFIEL
jgi:hypothetical protein